MRFDSAGVIHSLLKNLTIRFIDYAMRTPEYFGAFLLDARRAEAVDVASYFHLLAQGKVLNSPYDGFNYCHAAENKAASKHKSEPIRGNLLEPCGQPRVRSRVAPP
jgi:hypothetical protein